MKLVCVTEPERSEASCTDGGPVTCPNVERACGPSRRTRAGAVPDVRAGIPDPPVPRPEGLSASAPPRAAPPRAGSGGDSPTSCAQAAKSLISSTTPCCRSSSRTRPGRQQRLPGLAEQVEQRPCPRRQQPGPRRSHRARREPRRSYNRMLAEVKTTPDAPLTAGARSVIGVTRPGARRAAGSRRRAPAASACSSAAPPAGAPPAGSAAAHRDRRRARGAARRPLR